MRATLTDCEHRTMVGDGLECRRFGGNFTPVFAAARQFQSFQNNTFRSRQFLLKSKIVVKSSILIKRRTELRKYETRNNFVRGNLGISRRDECDNDNNN